MKRFRSAVAAYDLNNTTYYPDVQLVGEEALVSPDAVSLASASVLAMPVKEVAFIDPAIGEVPLFIDKTISTAQPIITEPIVTPLPTPVKEITFIDPVINATVDKPTLQEILSIKPVISPVEPIAVISSSLEKQVTYIDPVVSTPKVIPIMPIEDEPILSEAVKSSDTPGVITLSNSGSSNTNTSNAIEKVVDVINKGIDEIFSTEVSKDNSVAKDDTGLYLAGGVVILGILTLLFKK
jgi:hypothetical protein